MALELRIWEFGSDDSKIDSWLTSASLAHKIPKKSEEWFHWKFEQSPYGKAILACAFDGDTVVGCLSMGRGMMTYNKRIFPCALSYETFVHPAYQGKGLFKKLVAILEQECKKQRSELFYNFPNNNSIRGYEHMGFTQIPLTEFRIHIVNPFRCLIHFKDIRKSFVSDASNLDEIKDIEPINLPDVYADGVFVPQWNTDYIKWRFLTFQMGHYWIYNQNGIFAIFRTGRRGQLKQAELLHIAAENGVLTQKQWNEVERRLIKATKPDIVAVAASKDYPVYPFLKWYIKVPDRSHFTYKLLSDKLTPSTFRMAKCGIDAHTY